MKLGNIFHYLGSRNSLSPAMAAVNIFLILLMTYLAKSILQGFAL